MLRIFVRYWLPVLAYVTLIVVLSAQPNLHPPITFTSADKVAHVVEYFVLGLLLARAWTATLPPARLFTPIVIAMVMGIAIGAGDELFQRTVPGRDSNVYDLLADGLGVLFAQLTYLLSRRD